MKEILAEIHRRSLWQVLGIYLAASWVAIQVVNEIGDAVGLPEWVSGGAVVLLVIGFPIVLATAFLQHGSTDRGTVDAATSLTPVRFGAGSGAVDPSGSRESELLRDTLRPTADPTLSSATPVAHGSDGHQRPVPHRLFTWRNAILGGAGAFLLFGAGTGAWMALRALGIGPAGTLVAKGALEERALVVLADFEAEDAALADAATEALRVDLSQAEIIRLADPALVADGLERMGREPGTPLTAELATELAVREGAGAVISGEINRAGSGHVLSARVVAVSDRAVLTSQRESAADESDVIPAIDRLSKKLRERIGESFRTIRSDPPLERVTTGSLEALKLYSRARETGGEEAIALLEQAVALDSGFAMAWRYMGIVYRNREVERARMTRALTWAFELRDRLTERERRLTAADYYVNVEFDLPRGMVEYEALLDTDPRDLVATINLGALQSLLGDHEGSRETALRALELDPEATNPYWNSITALVNTGWIDSAQAIVDSARRVFDPGFPEYASTMVHQARGDLTEVERIWREFGEPTISDGARAELATNLTAVLAARGRVREADVETRLAISLHSEAGAATESLEAAIQGAWTDVVVRERPDAALARLDQELDRHPLDGLEPLDRPYVQLSELFARAGRPERARALLDEMRAAVDATRLRRHQRDIHRAEGEIAIAEGRPDEAIESFRRASGGFCHICPLSGMALAYESAGQPDSAAAVHRRYVETPYSDRFLPYTYPLGQALGPTYERLAELYDQLGDGVNAARFYAAFVELWADADEELQPRVRAAQSRLEAILEARG